jgi:hypothetical protein
MRLGPPHNELIPLIVKCYESKLAVFRRLTDIVSAILAGPKPNVDYGKLAKGFALEIPTTYEVGLTMLNVRNC